MASKSRINYNPSLSVKENAERCGVTVSTFRRYISEAGIIYLMNAPTISIMKMTGHKTEANFLRYINVSKEQHAAIITETFAKCQT